MDGIRDALLRMYRSAKDLKKMYETFKVAGFSADSLFDSYGNVADAIYYLIGEDVGQFENSITHRVLNHPDFQDVTDEEIVDVLMAEFRKNYTQPKPNVINMNFTDVFRKLYNTNGGYVAPTPEGEWQ